MVILGAAISRAETAMLPTPSSPPSATTCMGLLCQELLAVLLLALQPSVNRRETFQGSLQYPAASIAPRTCVRSNPMFDHDAAMRISAKLEKRAHSSASVPIQSALSSTCLTIS